MRPSTATATVPGMTEPAYIPGRAAPRRRLHPAVWMATGAAATILVIALAGGVYLLTRPGGIKGDPDQTQAISLCEDSIRGQLKAPATAKFSGETYTADDPVWTVTGAVDAQNGFGALIRSTWNCTLVKNAGVLSVASSNVVGGG